MVWYDHRSMPLAARVSPAADVRTSMAVRPGAFSFTLMVPIIHLLAVSLA